MAVYLDIDEIENDLHRLLLSSTPPDLSGEVTLTHLAKQLGVARYAVYKWIRNQRLGPERALAVVRLSRGRTTLADFHPFVYGVSKDEIERLSRTDL